MKTEAKHWVKTEGHSQLCTPLNPNGPRFTMPSMRWKIFLKDAHPALLHKLFYTSLNCYYKVNASLITNICSALKEK